jgi:hypothetical protein
MTAVQSIDVDTDRSLVRTICGEYNEMPGLQLTLAQACRLWNTDANSGAQALDTLVARAFLRRVGRTYVRADSAA